MARYHQLSIAEKRAENLARVREPAVTCPDCDMQVMPVDLLAHLEQRCQGRREPGPGAKWLTFREVMALGVPRATLAKWTRAGYVRFVGEVQDRKYLLRDLAIKVTQLRVSRRR